MPVRGSIEQNAPFVRRIIALGLAVGMLMVSSVSESAGAAPPPGPRLAVVKWDFFLERQVLETVNRSGAQPLRLAGGGERKRPLPELFEAPSWSPDGSQIAFAGMTRSFEAGPKGTRLYVVGADGKGLRPLLGTRGATSAVFASDGRSVAFTRFRRNGASIWLASISGGAPRRITSAHKGLYMFPSSFSPDGSRLLATRTVGSRREDAVSVDLHTGVVEHVIRRVSNPVYSPDGTKLAFVRWRPARYSNGSRTVESDIYTARADGTGVRRLTKTHLQDEGYPSWDPSGERLAFVRNLREPAENDLIQLGIGASVIQMNSDGSCLRRVLKPGPIGIYGAAWQPGPGRSAGRIRC